MLQRQHNTFAQFVRWCWPGEIVPTSNFEFPGVWCKEQRRRGRKLVSKISKISKVSDNDGDGDYQTHSLMTLFEIVIGSLNG